MMSLHANLQSFTALALDRMLYCLAEGILLAALLSLAMRLFPPRNSRTRFAIWLAALIAVAILPLLGAAGIVLGHGQGVSHNARSLLTIPATWAEAILAVWAAMALLGLLRVAAGWWHVHRLRRSCVAINPELLGPQLQSVIAQLRRSRPISILVSPSANVPAAVGFLKPIVVLPAWLAEESAARELEYVLRHELAHLRRWDDWTNLLEKIVKAVLFFHPGIWWIERKLSLDREMACDEAVLSELPEPRLYAECLARVAEKSFLRRQMTLAQAAVDRMKHLSHRIARILSLSSKEDQRRSTRFWKPAVATVAVAGALTAAWTGQAPVLVRLSDPAPVRTEAAAGSSAAASPSVHPVGFHQENEISRNTKSHPDLMVPALYQPTARERTTAPVHSRKRPQPKQQRRDLMQAQFVPDETAPNAPGETLITVVETRYMAGGQTPGALWQISVVEVHWIVPASHAKKEIPRKT
jgi:beta-lactamase regulating signal transducer with metallopeptidase domain